MIDLLIAGTGYSEILRLIEEINEDNTKQKYNDSHCRDRTGLQRGANPPNDSILFSAAMPVHWALSVGVVVDSDRCHSQEAVPCSWRGTAWSL